MKDSDEIRKAGFQAGDVIVGLEGFRIESLPQFKAVNAFFKKPEMKLTLWRGATPFEATITVPDRKIEIELRSYPINGLIE